MMSLAAVPTSALVDELNARRQRAPVQVAEVPGMAPSSPKKWGLFREGDVYPSPEGDKRVAWRQRYIALCHNAFEARELARLINEADALRALAAVQ